MKRRFDLLNVSAYSFALILRTYSVEEEGSGRECVASMQGKSLRCAYVG